MDNSGTVSHGVGALTDTCAIPRTFLPLAISKARGEDAHSFVIQSEKLRFAPTVTNASPMPIPATPICGFLCLISSWSLISSNRRCSARYSLGGLVMDHCRSFLPQFNSTYTAFYKPP